MKLTGSGQFSRFAEPVSAEPQYSAAIRGRPRGAPPARRSASSVHDKRLSKRPPPVGDLIRPAAQRQRRRSYVNRTAEQRSIRTRARVACGRVTTTTTEVQWYCLASLPTNSASPRVSAGSGSKQMSFILGGRGGHGPPYPGFPATRPAPAPGARARAAARPAFDHPSRPASRWRSRGQALPAPATPRTTQWRR